jgi:hypothetical protein
VVLDSVEDEIKISVGKEDASANKVMCWPFGKFLNSLYDFFGDMITTEFINEFGVVDLFS